MIMQPDKQAGHEHQFWVVRTTYRTGFARLVWRCRNCELVEVEECATR